MKYAKKVISLKRRIIPTEEQIHFIRHNCNKRRYLYNKCVEESRKYKNYKEFVINHLDKFRKELNDKEIEMVKERKDNEEDTSLYCADIPLSVYSDMKDAMKGMITRDKNRNDGKISKFRFKKFDPFRRAFKVRVNNTVKYDKNGKIKSYRGKVHFSNPYNFEFRASHDYVCNIFNITLKEPICDEYDKKTRDFIIYDKKTKDSLTPDIRCNFQHEDIKEIVFMEELGKFYIILVVEVIYIINEEEYSNRRKVAGIDLGIHNPVTLYDKKHKDMQLIHISLSKKELSEMQYLERKVGRLQRGMSIKYRINKARHEADPENYPLYSKNYRKKQRRLRKIYKRIANIRKHWRFSACHVITTNYKHIVVDEFNTPDNSELNTSNRLKRFYNKYNRNHGMYLFMEVLKHDAVKNGCEYIESPKYTTCRCHKCMHINPKLELGERILYCETEDCENSTGIDRDENAAKNCYQFFKNRNAYLQFN